MNRGETCLAGEGEDCLAKPGKTGLSLAVAVTLMSRGVSESDPPSSSSSREPTYLSVSSKTKIRKWFDYIPHRRLLG